MKTLMLALAMLFAAGALAQLTPVLTPPAPTTLDVITARFWVVACPNRIVTTVVTGSLVTTTVAYESCITVLPPAEETATFGPLPAGRYTHEVYIHDGGGPPVLGWRQQFTVSLPPIPSLSAWGYTVLAASIALAGLFATRRAW